MRGIPACVGTTGAHTPILAFLPQGGREGKGRRWIPACARTRVGGFVFAVVETKGGFGEGVGMGVFMGGMVAGEGDFGQWEVGTTGGGWVSVCASARRGARGRREGGHPHPSLPREGGRKGIGGTAGGWGGFMGEMVARGGRGWVAAFARRGEGGNGGGFGVEGVLMGGMVARRIEGMGPRIREDTDRGRAGGGDFSWGRW